MMTKEGSTKIVNFMTPGAGVLVLGRGHISDIVKMHYFFKNLLLQSQAQITQTMCILMMDNEESTKIVSFMTPGQGGLARMWPLKSYSENALFLLKLLLYFWGCLRKTQQDSFDDVPVDFYWFNRLYCSFPLPLLIFTYSVMGLLICKYQPF